MVHRRFTQRRPHRRIAVRFSLEERNTPPGKILCMRTGRVLTECYDETGAVTTFTVDPEGAGSRVTFTTVWSAPGLRGVVERALAPPFLRRVYAKELANLARAAARAAGG